VGIKLFQKYIMQFSQTAAFVARSWSLFMQTPLSLAITQLENRHVTKTVRELLYDGYEDPLVSLAGRLPALAKIDIPFDRFGWFYEVWIEWPLYFHE
jgi:hypothetical protein